MTKPIVMAVPNAASLIPSSSRIWTASPPIMNGGSAASTSELTTRSIPIRVDRSVRAKESMGCTLSGTSAGPTTAVVSSEGRRVPFRAQASTRERGRTVPETMQALVQTAEGFAEEIPELSDLTSLDPHVSLTTIPVPVPAKGQVLIRVSLSPINPSDLLFVAGAYGQPRVLGAPAGFEGVGEVVASGGGLLADRLTGRRVAFFAGVSGAWAEYAVAEATTCVPLRASVRDEDGAALLVNPFSAWAMYDLVRASGRPAFVMTAGASQLAKLLTTLAADNDQRPILLVRREEQVRPLLELGAAHVLNTEGPGFEDSLAEVVAAERPRVLLDAVSGPLPQKVFEVMGRKSRWVVYGGLDTRPARLPDAAALIFEGKKIDGFWLTSWLSEGTPLRMVRAAVAVQAMFSKGIWATDVAARVPLAESHRDVPGLLSGSNRGKVLLAPR